MQGRIEHLWNLGLLARRFPRQHAELIRRFGLKRQRLVPPSNFLTLLELSAIRMTPARVALWEDLEFEERCWGAMP